MPSKKQRAKKSKGKKKEKGIMIESGQLDGFVYIAVGKIFPQFPDYIIKTPAKELESYIESLREKKKSSSIEMMGMMIAIGNYDYKRVMMAIQQNIIKYSYEQLDNIRNASFSGRSNLYGNWNDDVVLYVAHNTVFNGELIPITMNAPDHAPNHFKN